MLQGVTCFNRVLHGFTGCHTVVHGVTRCYRVLHGVTLCKDPISRPLSIALGQADHSLFVWPFLS